MKSTWYLTICSIAYSVNSSRVVPRREYDKDLGKIVKRLKSGTWTLFLPHSTKLNGKNIWFWQNSSTLTARTRVSSYTLAILCVHLKIQEKQQRKVKWTKYMCFFYKHSVFQSEARICLSFSRIEPQQDKVYNGPRGILLNEK